MVLLPEAFLSSNISVVADKFFKALSSSFVLEKHEIFIYASIGISMCTPLMELMPPPR
jgi:hypothetical protein